jgi:hypothetical protein
MSSSGDLLLLPLLVLLLLLLTVEASTSITGSCESLPAAAAAT